MACKYTYGNQVYDSLDDLKAAVKNDLQRSADKEEVVDNNNQSNTITTKSDNISYKNNPTNLNTYLNYLGLKDIALNDAIFNAPIDAISKERVFLNTLQQIVENTPVLSAVDISEYVAKDKQKDLPDLKPLAQRIHALSMALSQNPSEKDLREYVKLNTELNAKIIELLTPHIKKVFGKDASIEYKTIRSVDPLYNPSQQLNTTVKPQGIINVYWGQAESATSTKILSNLAPRKFKYKSSDGISREYGSVEHAYQTLKSGSFDQVTYDKYIRAGGYGTKITGKIANKATNLQLMKDLVVASFEQNSDSPAAKKLLQYEKFTHNTNEIIDQAFLEGLKLAQAKLLSSQQSNTTQQSSVPYYTGSITPEPNTIFVFGSNPEGRHGLGAAKVAKEQFGAKYGQGEGLQGNAYALPTKDLRITENNGFKSITPEQITANIKRLYEAARQNPSKQFKIAYNEPAGKRSLNGYTGFEMIEMFNNAGERPANIIFSKHWVDTGKLNSQQLNIRLKDYSNVRLPNNKDLPLGIKLSVLTPNGNIKNQSKIWSILKNNFSSDVLDKLNDMLYFNIEGDWLFNHFNRNVIFLKVGEGIIPFYFSSKGTSNKSLTWHPFFGIDKDENWIFKQVYNPQTKTTQIEGWNTVYPKEIKMLNETLDWLSNNFNINNIKMDLITSGSMFNLKRNIFVNQTIVDSENPTTTAAGQITGQSTLPHASDFVAFFLNTVSGKFKIINTIQQIDTKQQTKIEAKITDVEVEAMTDALVEMYPEIEFGVENNPNFVDKEGVFNQRIENTNQNVDAEVLDKINSFELYEDKETLCPGGICNFTARKSTEHLIEVGLNPYPNTYNGSQLPVQVDSPMGPFKITHFVSAVAINDSVYIYDMPQNEFISDDFFGMGSDVKVKQAYKPRLIFLSLDDIQSNYNLSVEDAGNFIHSILNNRGWEGANAAPSFKEYISKNINNSEIYIKSLEDEISKSGYKMPEYFNREAYEKEVQDKRNNIINETLSKEDKDKVLNYYANKLRIKTREYLPTKTDSFSLRELVKSVIGDIEVNIDKSSFQNALASLKEFLNSKDFIDRLLHAYEFSGTNLKNAESSISDVYSTGRLMAGFINQVKSYGIVEALTKYSPEEQYKIKGLLSTDVLTKYKSKEQAALMLQKYWSNKDNIVKRLNLGKSFDNLMLSKFRYAASHNKLKTVLNYLKFSDFDSSNIYNAIANEATRRYTYFEKKNDVQFQKEGNQIIGQADIQARKILIDAAFKNKPDLASHEFAHFYIAWFRNTPLVQQGIRMYGSEEALVQAIGEQAVVQKGKAWSWWKKFVAWLLNSANDVSDLTKENLRDILTDAFLSRQDLNKQAGTEAGIKLEKNVAVLGGETYLWNNNTGFWQPFTKSEADIEYSNDEMQRRMQEERDEKAQVKNDPVIKPAWKNNKRAALENRLLNIHKAIALHPVNAQNLLAPVSTVITKGIVKKLGIRAKHETRGAVIDPLSNINASIAMVQGKQGVGIVANAINTKAALTGVDAKLTLMYPVQSPLSTDEKHTQLPINLRMLGIEKVRYADGTLAYSLGKLVDTFGNSIISNLSESLTQQVDNVKDPVAVELGYTLKTLGLTSYILTLGVPQEILAGLTAKGGIVTAWNDRVEENENLFHKGVTETNVYQNEFGQKETNTTKFEESNSTLKVEFIAALLRKEGVPSKYIETVVDENRKVKGYLLKHEALDADNVSLDKYDAVKLLFYWELIDQARAYGNTIKALTADTKTHKSIDAAAQQQLLIDQQLAGIDSIIDKDDISKVISSRTALKSNTKSVISPFFNMQRKYIEYFSKYFYTHDNGISSYLAANLKARYKLYNGDKLNRLISTAHNDFMIYLMTRMTAVNSNATSSLAKYNIDTAPLVEANALLKHGEGLKMSAVNSIYNNLVLISKQPNLTTSQNYYYAQPASARKNSTIELYQNITPEMARSLLDIFRFELGRVIKADVNVDNNTSIYLQNIPSVDLIMFKDSAITTSAANNYIEIFEELRTKSPKLIQLFNSISLFQAGLNNSPYNLFKTLPITDLLSEDKSKSLVSNLATTIRTFDKLLPKKGVAYSAEADKRSDAIYNMVDDFLRWFDLQYGKIYVQPEAASKYNKASRLYKAFSSKDQKFIIYVKNDEGGGTPLESVSSLTKNYLSTVPYTYAPTTTAVTNSNVITNDTINEDATIKQLESLGAFGDIIKAYVAAGGEIETLCS